MKKSGDFMAGTKKTKPVQESTELTAYDIKRTVAYRKIRNTLLEDLKKKGADKPVFLDMVETYMSMYVSKEMLNDDIERNGVKIELQGNYRDNPSIDKLAKIDLQMSKLRKELGVDLSAVDVTEVEEL